MYVITQSTRPCKFAGVMADERGERDVRVLDIAGRLVIFVADFLTATLSNIAQQRVTCRASTTRKFN